MIFDDFHLSFLSFSCMFIHFQASSRFPSPNSLPTRFPSVVNLITQVIGVFAFIEVVRKRREAIPSRVAFSGKPEIVMAIVRDPANPSGVVLRSS